ncbi:hypothetical protein Tco_0638519 [Tanacetum coccineum]
MQRLVIKHEIVMPTMMVTDLEKVQLDQCYNVVLAAGKVTMIGTVGPGETGLSTRGGRTDWYSHELSVQASEK